MAATMKRPLQARNTVTSNTMILAWVEATVCGEKDSCGGSEGVNRVPMESVSSYQLETVFAELLSEQESSEEGEPHTPTHHLRHLLHIQHTKHKDELVEDKVPELVPHVLRKRT